MMNQEQREYTVEQVKKNDKTIEKLNKDTNLYAFALGVGTLGFTLFATNLGVASDLDITTKVEFLVKAIISGGQELLR